MVLKQYPIMDQKNGSFCQTNAKFQPPQRNLKLGLRNGSLKTAHVMKTM